MNDKLYEQILAKNRAEAAAQRAQPQHEAAPAVAVQAEEPQPVETGSMHAFVNAHREAKLPKVARQNKLMQRQRNALYGIEERQLRNSRGDYTTEE